MTELFLLSTAAMLVSVLKLTWLINRSFGIHNFITVTKAYYLGTFFNNFIPTSVGGDLIKASSLLKLDDTTFRDTSFSVLVERLSGTLVLVAIALYFLIFLPSKYAVFDFGLNVQRQYWIFLFFVLVVSGLLIHFLYQHLFDGTSTFGVRSYLRELINFPANQLLLTAGVIILSLFFHLIRALIFIIMTRTIGFDLSLLDALFILPLIAFGSFLPVSFGSLGIREGIITACLATLGLGMESAFAVALVYRFLTILHSLVGGVVYLTDPISLPTTPQR
jgi:uncharacterized membrane protein YbhN (UPF0104 family)